MPPNPGGLAKLGYDVPPNAGLDGDFGLLNKREGGWLSSVSQYDGGGSDVPLNMGEDGYSRFPNTMGGGAVQ